MIERTERGGVAVLRMAHGKANALDVELAAGLASALDEVARSRARAVVLTGSGGIFSAGVDLFRVLDGGAAYLERFLPELERAFHALFTFSGPVVGAVNGHAIAGGGVMTAACDHKIMARGAGRIGVPELLVGVPFPTLALEIVRFALPPQHFQAAVYTGATYAPDEAVACGFVDELAEPDDLLDRACAAAERLGAIPRESFRITKRAIRGPTLERVRETAPALDAEVEAAWRDPDVHETIRDYVKRTIRRGQSRRPS